MEFTALSPQQRQKFEDDGFLVLPNVLDPSMIDRLVTAGDRLINSDRLDMRQRTKDGQYDSFRNVISMDDAFIPLLTHPKVFPLIAQLMSPNLALWTTHLIYKHSDPPSTPVTRRDPGWHRDNLYTPYDLGQANVPRLDIKAAFYLSDLLEPNSGVTLFSPGTHHLKERMIIPPGRVDPLNVVESRLKAGDCVLFENRTWHAGGVNLSGRTRKAVMFGYSYQWMRPADYVEQPRRILDQVDDIGKQLLGGLTDSEGRFVPGGINEPLVKWWHDNGLPAYPPKGN